MGCHGRDRDLLKDSYGQPSVGSAHTELKKLLATTILMNSHPAPALQSITANFAYLKEAGFEISLPVQTMILVAKLPPSMEVVAQLINQTKPADIKTLKPDKIIAAATLAFEQRSQRSTTGNGHQANKLSAVKRKQADPKFAQQQQQAPKPQQQQGGGGQSGNAPTNHGDKHRRGGKKARCYNRFSSPVGTENRGGSEVEEILTAAHREFGGCAHRCTGKPKRREQDRASLRRRGHAQSGTAEE